MDVLDAIFTRRSIRQFTGEPVSERDLKTILRAGFYAPSARNTQPWHFVVVREPGLLECIAQSHPFAKMLPQAGCCIVVCGDQGKQSPSGFLIQDCSAAMQNMLLAAHGLGLGAVWCGLYPDVERTRPLIDLLHLPEAILPVALMALGHKNEERQTEERYSSEKVHYDRW